MKLNAFRLAVALMVSTLPQAFAAQELSSAQILDLTPFKKIQLSGHFATLSEVGNAVSSRTDSQGALGYHVIAVQDNALPGGERQITANLYRQLTADAPAVPEARYYGIKELPKAKASRLEPFDTVTVNGFFPNGPAVKSAVALAAKAQQASAFYIVRQVAANNGGNQQVTAFIYKADAPVRQVQSTDVIPHNSQAATAALAAGGSQAKQVEIEDVPSSQTLSNKIGRFFETQSSSTKRYTLDVDGKKIEELNNITAAKMTPFDTVTITAHFGNPSLMSQAIARRAADKGAKFYHITRQWQSNSGGNMTVTAELFK